MQLIHKPRTVTWGNAGRNSYDGYATICHNEADGSKNKQTLACLTQYNQQVLHGAPLSLPSTLFMFIVVDADMFILSLLSVPHSL